jgi:hypothetical protein
MDPMLKSKNAKFKLFCLVKKINQKLKIILKQQKLHCTVQTQGLIADLDRAWTRIPSPPS